MGQVSSANKLNSMILGAISQVSSSNIANAPYDKTFKSRIVGINRIFIDDVSSEDRSGIIDKYSIPSTLEEGDYNYYTFAINGIYYCKQQNGNFKLYEDIMVFIPNGDWSRMYIETVTPSITSLPNRYVSADEPEGFIIERDYWIQVNGAQDIIALWQYLPDDDNRLGWQLLCNVNGEGSGVGVFLDDAHTSEGFNHYETVDGNPPNSSTMGFDHVEGYNNHVTGTGRGVNHVEGQYHTVENSYNVHVEGYSHTLQGRCDAVHVSGKRNSVTGSRITRVGGIDNTVTGCSECNIDGLDNTVTGCTGTIVHGDGNNVTASDAGVFGSYNNVSAQFSGVFGHDNIVNMQNSLACGFYGTTDNRYLFVVGYGSASSPQNVFAVDGSGNVYAAGNYSTVGADYAEYFEWADGNPDNEDRCGMLVALDCDKIIPANGDDIIGAISGRASVVGNDYEMFWQGKYETDVYGRIVYDENGKPVISERYNRDIEYVPRSLRKEWTKVGMKGRLIINDDGTCVVNGYVTSVNGIAKSSKNVTSIRVLKRINENHIEVLI